MDFSKFDEQVDTKKLAADAEEAIKNGGTGDFPEIPDGRYIAKIESMELSETKKDGRPMVKVQFRLTEAAEENETDSNDNAIHFIEDWPGKKMPCLFMNRVVYGTKNDANAIASVLGFLRNLDSEVTPIAFESYSQFADLILDIMEDIDGVLEYEIKYEKDKFNSISILDVFEV